MLFLHLLTWAAAIAQYALLFPGEAYESLVGHQQVHEQSPKESVWALYCRSMLLWNSCTCVQRDETLTTDQRASFAISAFQETREIQDALDMHVCNLDTGLMYVCREYLYKCVFFLPSLSHITCRTDVYRLCLVHCDIQHSYDHYVRAPPVCHSPAHPVLLNPDWLQQIAGWRHTGPAAHL